MRAIIFFVVFITACYTGQTAQKLISGVPNYDQDIFPIDEAYASIESGDCVPIACTMLHGYHDANGWPRLIPYGGNSMSQNAWGIDTVVRKYKTQLNYSDGGVSGKYFSSWRWFLGLALGNQIASVVRYFEPNAAFSREDDDLTNWTRIQSYLNANRPCVLGVTPGIIYNPEYKWEGNTAINEISGGHAVCAVGWSDSGGHWVMCNMGWLYTDRAWFNHDGGGDWYISQITPGGSSSGADDDAYEDNDTIGTARQISGGTLSNLRCLDTLISGDAYGASWGDWFKVTASAGQSLSVTTTFTHANGDLDLRVFNPSQTEMGSSTGSGNSESVTVSPTTAGSYYVFVYGFDGAMNQNYSLTVGLSISPSSAPTVRTDAATNKTSTSATLNATITDTGGGSISEARFEWTASGFPGTVIYNVPVSGSTFSYNLTGLQPNTSYTYHAYAKNSAGFNASTNNVTFTTNAAQDTTPDGFTFTDVTGAELNTSYTSNQVTISGINAAAAISVTGGSYTVNGGSYTTASGTVANGATVRVRQTSSGSYSTMTSATLTIGGVSDRYDVTTKANAQTDTTPDAFAFTDLTGAEVNTNYTSNQIAVSGINAAAAISITGGSYSVNGGSYTTASGTVTNGATVTVRQTSSGSFLTKTSAALIVGGVSDSYDVTTKSEVLSPSVAYVFSTFAGRADEFGSDDGLGGAARFAGPMGLTMDNAGNLYVADRSNSNIRKISPAGVVTTVAGSAGNSGSTDGTGSAARFYGPYGLTIDPSGNLYVADNYDHVIRKVTPAGVVTTVAGLAGSRGSSDGTGGNARFNYPSGIVIDTAGNLFVTDYSNSTVRKITPGGVVTTLAGLAGSSGSTDGTGSNARFSGPAGLAIDAAGNLFIAEESNHTIRKVTPGGSVSTVAGLAGASGSADGTGSSARFYSPVGVAVDAAGNLFVSEWVNRLIRRVTPAGIVTTLGGMAGVSGSTDGIGGAARFDGPAGIVAGSAGHIYVADYHNGTVRKGVPFSADTEPAITAHPGNQAVAVGGGASFTVGVSGTAPFSYYWQVSAPGSTSWTDLTNGGVYSGVNTATLTITGATAGLNGNVYRCVIFNAAGHAISEWARLTVTTPAVVPTVGTHPAGKTVTTGGSTNFTVGVSGTAPFSYYWQVSAPGSTGWTDLTNGGVYSGANTATLTITGATAGLNGNVYRCVIFNAAGHAISEWARLTVTTPAVVPTVGTHPANKTVTTGASTSFTVGVSGTTPFSYYWQVSAPGSTGWTDLTNGGVYSGVNTATLAITGATAVLNGNVYRCVIFNPAGHAISEWARLTVNTPAVVPTVGTHPANKTVTAGGSTSFTVGVSGTVPFSYFWQVSAPGSTGWTDLTNGGVYSGVNTATLAITGATAVLNGNVYRCVIFNPAGHAISEWARLTVNTPAVVPTVGTHPANKTVTAGGSTSFTVGVSGTVPFSYFWQVSAPGSTGWTDLTNGGVYSGVNTATLAITGATAGLNGNVYRCVIFNAAGHAISEWARLTVNTPAVVPTVGTHPANKTMTTGGSTNFTVGVSGTAPFSYYWQVSAPGSTGWTDLANGGVYSGVNTATLTITGAPAGLNGNVYRCVIFNAAGHAISEWARLTVNTPAVAPTVGTPPTSKTVTTGGSTSFTVGVSGTAPFSYYWQVSAPGSTGWTDLANGGVYGGVNTATLAITGATAGLNGNVYRCVIFNSAGHAVSEWARLIVTTPAVAPSVTTPPTNKTVTAGGSTSFTVGVSGTAPFSYYWQVSVPGSTIWADLADNSTYGGTRTATLQITGGTSGLNHNSYRCQVFNNAGYAVSNGAVLTVTGGGSSSAPVIMAQPGSTTSTEGTITSFMVVVNGTSPFNYYWQVSPPGSTSWTDLANNTIRTGSNTSVLTQLAVTGMNGNSYRCQIFNAFGYAVSESGVLTVADDGVVSAPVILTQPATVLSTVGARVSFSVEVSGTGPYSYYWQVSAPGSTSWTDLTNGGVYSGVNTSTLTVTDAATGLSGNVYRCVIFNPVGHAVSEWARLTVTSGSSSDQSTATTESVEITSPTVLDPFIVPYNF